MTPTPTSIRISLENGWGGVDDVDVGDFDSDTTGCCFVDDFVGGGGGLMAL